MRTLLLALVVALAGLDALAPTAAACHPYHIDQLSLGPETVYYWVDQGCPHTIPRMCAVLFDPTLGYVPLCI